MTTTMRFTAPLVLGALLSAFGCGGEITPGEALVSPEEEGGMRGTESTYLKWWNSPITYSHIVSGWVDTDLGVGASTPVQLKNAARLTRYGVYGWGYMPEFVDLVTGAQFKILHLRPQHQWATSVGHVYPAGYVVGLSGGDTYDTGNPKYSTGAHLCIQTLVSYRSAFPAGSGGGGGPAGGGSGCYSATLARTVGPGTCVQSSKDANWYTCENGSWVGGQDHCGMSYPFCHSATLNRSVPARSCVESRADRVWYQCDAHGWASPVHSGAGPAGSCSVEYAL